MKITYLALLIALLVLSACDRPPEAERTDAIEAAEVTPSALLAPEAKPVKQEIAWFDGSIDQAFALARAQDKPLFLYWGAVWCPPCV